MRNLMVNILKWCNEIALTTYNGIGVCPPSPPTTTSIQKHIYKKWKTFSDKFHLGRLEERIYVMLCLNEAHLSLDILS